MLVQSEVSSCIILKAVTLPLADSCYCHFFALLENKLSTNDFGFEGGKKLMNIGKIFYFSTTFFFTIISHTMIIQL